MTPTIAFVGAGPTTLYSLAALVDRTDRDVRVTVYEAQSTAGPGAPYRPGWNDPAMLSNIASIEIPPLDETLLEWVEDKSPAERRALGIDPKGIDDREFVPRVALGRYFQDRFDALVAKARARGIAIEVRTGSRVADVRDVNPGVQLSVVTSGQAATREVFDHVVLATGHQWPSRQEVRPGYFLSPWPASALAALPPVNVGVRGSSLTAIDTAVALAVSHGAFVRTEAGLSYAPSPNTSDFMITLMSRKGLLPEADFYFPLPHAPLAICTSEAVQALIDEDRGDLLDAVFELFRSELVLVDPDYVRSTELEQTTVETFGERYFAERAGADPFTWAESNLAEARHNHAARLTIPWRDAILRMHDVVAAIVPHLDADQFERFNRAFKPVFVDAYAGVPHESIERMLALHRAGKLEVLALGGGYDLDTDRPQGGVLLRLAGKTRYFPIFIEATGQRALSGLQFPFLSLLEQGIVRDEDATETPGASRGIVIDDQYQIVAEGLPAGRLFCVSLPFIMGRHPFAQGLTSSKEMGDVVGCALAEALQRRSSETAEAA